MKNINKSARNIKDVKLIKDEGTNIYDLFKYKTNEFDLSKAKKVFGYSILYLFLIFVLFLVDSLI